MEALPGGGMIFVGETETRLYQMIAQKHAIRLEIKGIRVARRSVTNFVKKQYGFKGNKQKVLEQLEALIEQQSAKARAESAAKEVQP